jgi:hypothetical protein
MTLLFGGGPLLRGVHGTVSLAGMREQSATGLELGALGRVGVERRFGPGSAGVLLDLSLGSHTEGLFTTSPAALSFSVGYGVPL